MQNHEDRMSPVADQDPQNTPMDENMAEDKGDAPQNPSLGQESMLTFSWRRFGISLGLCLILISLSVVAFRWIASAAPQARYVVAGERTYVVTTQRLTPLRWTQDLSLSGTILAERQGDLRPLVSGQVRWVNPNLRDGGRVSVGEILIEIDPVPYERSLRQAALSLNEAQDARDRQDRDLSRQNQTLNLQQAQLDLAEQELQRAQGLFDQGLISQALYEQTRSQTLAQQATVSATENSLAGLQDQLATLETNLLQAQISHDLAAENLANTQLRAPFAGLIQASAVQQGQLVSVGDLAARLIDDTALSVQFRLNEADFAALNTSGTLIGRPVEIQGPGQEMDSPLSATLSRQGANLDASASGVPVFADLDPDASARAIARGLRPGSFVTLSLQGQTYDQVYAIPRDAYFSDLQIGSGPAGGIYIIDRQDVAHGAQWSGPTDPATLRAINDWLNQQSLETFVEALLPADLAGTQEDQPFSELYECKPLSRRSQRSNRRQDEGETRGDGEDTPQDQSTQRSELALKIRNRPALLPEETQRLCPPAPQDQARAVAAPLLIFADDVALIPATSDLSGQAVVTTRFDRLANGTWLSLSADQQP